MRASSIKRSIAARVALFSLGDIRNLATFAARKAWLTEHFDGWSQGSMHYLQTSMARRARAWTEGDGNG